MTRQPAKPQRKPSPENLSRGIYRAAQSLTERFEQQVALHGARLALTTHNQALTYDQLNRAANRLGRAILTAIAGRRRTDRVAFQTRSRADHGEPGGAQDRPAVCPDRRQTTASAGRPADRRRRRALDRHRQRALSTAHVSLPATMLSWSISTRSTTISPTAISA